MADFADDSFQRHFQIRTMLYSDLIFTVLKAKQISIGSVISLAPFTRNGGDLALSHINKFTDDVY